MKGRSMKQFGLGFLVVVMLLVTVHGAVADVYDDFEEVGVNSSKWDVSVSEIVGVSHNGVQSVDVRDYLGGLLMGDYISSSGKTVISLWEYMNDTSGGNRIYILDNYDDQHSVIAINTDALGDWTYTTDSTPVSMGVSSSSGRGNINHTWVNLRVLVDNVGKVVSIRVGSTGANDATDVAFHSSYVDKNISSLMLETGGSVLLDDVEMWDYDVYGWKGPPLSIVNITECTDIVESGIYVLQNNISAADCVAQGVMLIDSSGVTLDCNGYTILADTSDDAIFVNFLGGSSSNLIIKNCLFEGSGDYWETMNINQVTNFLIQNSTIGGGPLQPFLYVRSSTGSVVDSIITGGLNADIDAGVSFSNVTRYVTDCMVMDQSNTTYTVQNDLSGGSPNMCLVVRASDVVIDCQGHLVNSTTVYDAINVWSNEQALSNITIRNCYAAGNDNSWPIEIGGVNGVSNVVVENTNVSRIFYLEHVENVTVRNMVAGAVDLYAVGSYLKNVVFDNITLSGMSGTDCGDGVGFCAYGGGGVVNNIVLANSSIVNTGTGIYAAFDAETLIVYNTIINASVHLYSVNPQLFNTTVGNMWLDENGTGFSETCIDGNSDGVCDSQYNISGTGNIDYLPQALVVGQNSGPVCTKEAPCEMNVTDCMVMDQANTTYIVQNDIHDVVGPHTPESVGSACLVINASDVIFDGNGKLLTIQDDADTDMIWFEPGVTNAVLKNFTGIAYNGSWVEFIAGNGVIFDNGQLTIQDVQIEIMTPGSTPFDIPYSGVFDSNANISFERVVFNGSGSQYIPVPYLSSRWTIIDSRIECPDLNYPGGWCIQGTGNLTVRNSYLSAADNMHLISTGTNSFANVVLVNNTLNASLYVDESPQNSVVVLNDSTVGNMYLRPNGAGFSETCIDVEKDGVCDKSYDVDGLGYIDYLPQATEYGLAPTRILVNFDGVTVNGTFVTDVDGVWDMELLGSFDFNASGFNGTGAHVNSGPDSFNVTSSEEFLRSGAFGNNFTVCVAKKSSMYDDGFSIIDARPQFGLQGYVGLQGYGGGELSAYVQDVEGDYVYVETSADFMLNDSQWHYYCVVYDGGVDGDAIRFYRDGMFVARNTGMDDIGGTMNDLSLVDFSNDPFINSGINPIHPLEPSWTSNYDVDELLLLPSTVLDDVGVQVLYESYVPVRPLFSGYPNVTFPIANQSVRGLQVMVVLGGSETIVPFGTVNGGRGDGIQSAAQPFNAQGTLITGLSNNFYGSDVVNWELRDGNGWSGTVIASGTTTAGASVNITPIVVVNGSMYTLVLRQASPNSMNLYSRVSCTNAYGDMLGNDGGGMYAACMGASVTYTSGSKDQYEQDFYGFRNDVTRSFGGSNCPDGTWSPVSRTITVPNGTTGRLVGYIGSGQYYPSGLIYVYAGSEVNESMNVVNFSTTSRVWNNAVDRSVSVPLTVGQTYTFAQTGDRYCTNIPMTFVWENYSQTSFNGTSVLVNVSTGNVSFGVGAQDVSGQGPISWVSLPIRVSNLGVVTAVTPSKSLYWTYNETPYVLVNVSSAAGYVAPFAKVTVKNGSEEIATYNATRANEIIGYCPTSYRASGYWNGAWIGETFVASQAHIASFHSEYSGDYAEIYVGSGVGGTLLYSGPSGVGSAISSVTLVIGDTYTIGAGGSTPTYCYLWEEVDPPAGCLYSTWTGLRCDMQLKAQLYYAKDVFEVTLPIGLSSYSNVSFSAVVNDTLFAEIGVSTGVTVFDGLKQPYVVVPLNGTLQVAGPFNVSVSKADGGLAVTTYTVESNINGSWVPVNVTSVADGSVSSVNVTYALSSKMGSGGSAVVGFNLTEPLLIRGFYMDHDGYVSVDAEPRHYVVAGYVSLERVFSKGEHLLYIDGGSTWQYYTPPFDSRFTWTNLYNGRLPGGVYGVSYSTIASRDNLLIDPGMVEGTFNVRVRATDGTVTTADSTSGDVQLVLSPSLLSQVCPGTVDPNAEDLPSVASAGFTFSVYAPLGFSSPVVVAKVKKGGVESVASCSPVVVDSTHKNYTCSAPIRYFYAPGAWDVSVNYTDGVKSVQGTASGICTVGETLSVSRTVSAVTFPGAAPGISNSPANTPVVMKNFGNMPVNLSMKGFDLVGRQNPSFGILAGSFKAGASLGSAFALSNNVSQDLSMTLNPGEGATANIYMWLSLPVNQLLQDYYSPITWQVVSTQ